MGLRDSLPDLYCCSTKGILPQLLVAGRTVASNPAFHRKGLKETPVG